MNRCYFCYESIDLNNERYGIYLHQLNEKWQLAKGFVCEDCDRSLGDDDIRDEIAEILKQRTGQLEKLLK